MTVLQQVAPTYKEKAGAGYQAQGVESSSGETPFGSTWLGNKRDGPNW